VRGKKAEILHLRSEWQAR